jgi:hypothetical protein
MNTRQAPDSGSLEAFSHSCLHAACETSSFSRLTADLFLSRQVVRNFFCDRELEKVILMPSLLQFRLHRDRQNPVIIAYQENEVKESFERRGPGRVKHSAVESR